MLIQYPLPRLLNITVRLACRYVFDWESSAACPIGHENEGQDCKVADFEGNVYDLSGIAHVEWDIDDKWATTVATFAVCDHLEAGCGADKFSGACFYDDKHVPHSLGTFHNNVEFLNDNVFMRAYAIPIPHHEHTHANT